MHRLLFSLSLSDIATCIMSSLFGGDRDALAALNQDYILSRAADEAAFRQYRTTSRTTAAAAALSGSRVGADHAAAAPAQPNANPLIDELNAGFLGSSTPSPPRRRRRQEPAPQAAPPVPAVAPAVQPPAQPPAQPRGPRGNYNVAERGNADPERARQRFIQHVCRAAHP